MKYGRTVERVFLLVVAVGAVYFVAYTVYSDLRATKEVTLFYQLQILRMGVNIHQLVNHRNPASLGDMVTKTYQLGPGMFEKRFVDGMTADSTGRIFDPFGNPYSYDPISGWVRSVTSGYEFW